MGKQLDPEFDVFSCVVPYLVQAAEKYPTGKAPRREVPQKNAGGVSDPAT